MKFYTHQMKPGVLAEFSETVAAPWGEQIIRGKIIHSTRDNREAVIWPTDGRRGRIVSTPPHDQIASAEAYILERFREFNRGRLAA